MGFSSIALVSPKTPSNVGSVLRAAHCYRVSSVVIGGPRGASTYGRWCRKSAANTPRAEKHLPVICADDAMSLHPVGASFVAVDLVEGAVPLHEFSHPKSAVYVFGPEDGTLGARHLDRCAHRVMIPTAACMNLAATVNVVLYDRLSKQLAASKFREVA